MILPFQQIVCHKIIPTEQENSDINETNPVFDIYLTKVSDPSSELFQDILAFSNAVDDKNFISNVKTFEATLSH